MQGFGNVGPWAVRLLRPHGSKLIAVEDVTGAIFNAEGIDPDELTQYEEVDCKLHKKIVNAYRVVSNTAQEYNTDWRTAAYVVALLRLEMVYKERGVFP